MVVSILENSKKLQGDKLNSCIYCDMVEVASIGTIFVVDLKSYIILYFIHRLEEDS